MTCLIDILVPCYNDREGLVRCLRSLSEQTLSSEKFVVNVVDDGSDEDLESVTLSVPNLNVNFFKHEKNLGLPYALNTALGMSKSRYFVRVDCDDYVHHCFLQSFLWAFENNPDTIAVSCDYKKVDELEHVISYHRAMSEPIGCGIMFRRIVIDVIGQYDTEMLMAEDTDFFLRFKSKFKMEYLGICSYRYTQKAGTLTTKDAEYNSFLKLANKKHLVRKGV